MTQYEDVKINHVPVKVLNQVLEIIRCWGKENDNGKVIKSKKGEIIEDSCFYLPEIDRGLIRKAINVLDKLEKICLIKPNIIKILDETDIDLGDIICRGGIEVEMKEKKMVVKGKILNFLKDGKSYTAQEITCAVSAKKGTVYFNLKALSEADGLVKVIKRGGKGNLYQIRKKITSGSTAKTTRIRITEYINDGREYTKSQIAEELQMSKSTVYFHLQRMVKEGLITATQNSHDKRSYSYQIKHKTENDLITIRIPRCYVSAVEALITTLEAKKKAEEVQKAAREVLKTAQETEAELKRIIDNASQS